MSTIYEIMLKAIKLPFQSKELMLQVFKLLFFPFLLVVSLHSLIATPLIEKVEDNYENSSINHLDTISLVITEISFAFSFSLVLLFSCSLTISASALTHQGTSSTLKEILLALKWKRILVTWLYCLSIMASFVGITVLLAILTASVSVLAALSVYPYLGSICTVMLVISVLEDGRGEDNLFKHASKTTAGEGFKGYRLMLVSMLLSSPVYVLFYVTAIGDVDEIGLIISFTFLLGSTFLFCVSVFFQNVVFTLFYLNSMEMLGEKI